MQRSEFREELKKNENLINEARVHMCNHFCEHGSKKQKKFMKKRMSSYVSRQELAFRQEKKQQTAIAGGGEGESGKNCIDNYFNDPSVVTKDFK